MGAGKFNTNWSVLDSCIALGTSVTVRQMGPGEFSTLGKKALELHKGPECYSVLSR